MEREDLSQLYTALVKSKFSFVPQGRRSLKEVYSCVQERFPEFCDDTYLCSENCKNGHNRPEWKHRVRAAIWEVKDASGYVARDAERGFWVFGDANEATRLPQEASATSFSEGHAVQITVNRYERSAKARSACIDNFGVSCSVCGVELKEIYGEVATELIHVHHLNPISLSDAAKEIDPIEDLRPVCPNCHAVIHLRNPPFSIAEVSAMMAARKINTEQAVTPNA